MGYERLKACWPEPVVNQPCSIKNGNAAEVFFVVVERVNLSLSTQRYLVEEVTGLDLVMIARLLGYDLRQCLLLLAG